MTFLPIVERELRTAARRTATYRNRVITAGIVTVAAMVMLVFGVFSASPSQIGRSTFWALSYFALAFCLFEGVRKTADCLSEEKREGTLGLLFLTDLKGYDVVLGKLAGMSLNSIYGLVAILPVLALPMLLGGVMPDEFWRVVLALVSILFFSLSVGMLVSAATRRERRARTGTFIVIALISTLPLLTFQRNFFPASPLYAFQAAGAGTYLTAPQTYWRSMEITQGITVSLLILASLIATRFWQDEKTQTRSFRSWQRRATQGSDPATFARRAQKLDINPAYWLASRDSGQRFMLSLGIALAAGGGAIAIFAANMAAVPAFMVMCVVLNLVLKMRVAAQSCHCLAEARRNNALEMLLATPLSVERIIQGQLLLLKRIFLVPLAVILSLEVIGVLAAQYAAFRADHFRGHVGLDDFFGLSFETGSIIAYVVMFVLDIFALIWSGMWFGLSSKKESQAVTKTILFALVLPMLSGMFFCYGFPFIIGIPIFLIAWASQKVRREFRNLAAQQYRGHADSGWIPGI